jgi:hypothetical protein
MIKTLLYRLFCILIVSLTIFSACKKDESTDHEWQGGKVTGELFVSNDGDDNGDGTIEYPWKTISRAIDRLGPGATLNIREGTYDINYLIRIPANGTQDSIITIRAYPGESVVINCNSANIRRSNSYPYVQGAIQIENASWVVLKNIIVKNSHQGGINVINSSHIEIINCVTENTLCSGIAAWQGCSYINVSGNTVINANDMDMSWDSYTGSEAPHEAISMAGPHYFEVAWNHVYDCQKEGIDCKETCAHGNVHHNYMHNLQRQGLYIDAWFGQLEDIEMHHNVVYNCEEGIAVSCENGPLSKDIKIHHNLIFNNRSAGLFFSRWGVDNPRENVEVYNNTLYHNGYGWSQDGDPDYWLTGGIYLFSINLKDIFIRNNILSFNKPFEIGHTMEYREGDLEEKNIVIEYNLINDINTVPDPFYMATWTKDSVYSITGENSMTGDPLFIDPSNGDFRLKSGSPAIDAGNPDPVYNDPDGSRNDPGAFPYGDDSDYFWWKNNFPPVIEK